jgi:hypothetical protein
MSVTESRLIGSCDIRRIIQGERLLQTIELLDEVSGQALTVIGASAASVTYPGTLAPVVKTLGDGIIIIDEPGRLTVNLSETDTALMKNGCGQAFQVQVTLADGSIRIAQLRDQLDVMASLF